MIGRRLFSMSVYDVAKPKRSILGSTAKYLFTLTLVGSNILLGGAVIGAYYTLETIKYVEIRKVKSFIPKDRNIIQEQNPTNASQAIKDAANVMLAVRKQTEPTTSWEMRRKFHGEAVDEARVLLYALLFGFDKAEGVKIVSEILPYFLNETEIQLSSESLKKWSSR